MPLFLRAGADVEQQEDVRQAMGSPILVLDELDSGVGARLGQPVGKMLARMAASGSTGPAQILCISHLPQVRRFCSTLDLDTCVTGLVFPSYHLLLFLQEYKLASASWCVFTLTKCIWASLTSLRIVLCHSGKHNLVL